MYKSVKKKQVWIVTNRHAFVRGAAWWPENRQFQQEIKRPSLGQQERTWENSLGEICLLTTFSIVIPTKFCLELKLITVKNAKMQKENET